MSAKPLDLAPILGRVDSMSSGPASLRVDVRDLLAEVRTLRRDLATAEDEVEWLRGVVVRLQNGGAA